MIFLLISVFIPLLVYFGLPPVVATLSGSKPSGRSLLLMAGICFFVSWYIPSPLIQGKNTAFNTHVLGGGIFSGFVWIYLKNQFKWRSSRLVELASLYALVCALGVANELFELTIVQLKLVHLDLADTSWDLLANTLGALVFWITYTFFVPHKPEDQASSRLGPLQRFIGLASVGKYLNQAEQRKVYDQHLKEKYD